MKNSRSRRGINNYLLLNITERKEQSDPKSKVLEHSSENLSPSQFRGQGLKRVNCKDMHANSHFHVHPLRFRYVCCVFSYAWREFRSECLKTRH